MPERTTPDTTALMAQLSYWSAYTEGVADTTNESYDHVLKNLSSTYKDAVNAIRNDFGEDLDRVASQFEMMMPAMEEFRGYDEGEQETRIVQAFDILKSDVENHINARQQVELERKQLPAKIELDAVDIWLASCQLHLTAACYNHFVLRQEADETVHISRVFDGKIESVRTVSGRILNADGEPYRGTVPIFADDFHSLAAEMHADVSNSDYAWGAINVNIERPEHLSDLYYEGVCFHDDEAIFQSLPQHLERTAIDFMHQHSGTKGYRMKSETIVTNESMEVSLAFAELGQNFDINITKTVDDGDVRYKAFVTNNLPQDEDLAAAVKDVWDALSGVAEHYCDQATARGFNQDFIENRVAEIKHEKPNVFTPPSSLSPAAPSGGGIKRPSGLSAPGERKPSVGGRSL